MSFLAQLDYWHLLLLIGGAAAGFCLSRWKDGNLQEEQRRQLHDSMDNARREASNLLHEARLKAGEEALRTRAETEQSSTSRQKELAETEQQLVRRESQLQQQLEGIAGREQTLREQQARVAESEARVGQRLAELELLTGECRDRLAAIAQLNQAEARAQLLKEIETAAQKDANDISRRIIEQTKARAEQEARRILSLALQRYASEHTFETTTATISLSGDEIKGRIIGREGRNIRAFEAATGVTVLIDDTPGAVVLSGFDPVRREIAREAMQRLILDGRIHPTRIEEVVSKVTEEIDETIAKAGEEAVFQAGVPPLPAEITRQLGRLKFRQSFSQNVLAHSVEVAHFCGLMAAELGLDVATAKRAGLLHDIGKTLNQEMEGAHAIVGAEFIKRHGEEPFVVNGVASHHDEVEHTCPYGILVSAADAISAARPGARSETMTTYLKRLENLEKIGASFPGVEKCYAIQAGRELRVMVNPESMDDETATTLARRICRQIENELQYPGQIRVTVIREHRVVEFAK